MNQVTRRQAMQLASGSLLAKCALGGKPVLADTPESNAADIPTPTDAQVTWQDCEIGLIYHFDLPIAAGVFAPNNSYRRTLDPEQYNPTRLDTDQWIEAATAVGAKYAVFTATHFNGFMQWQSDLYPYGVKQSKWRSGRGDVVDDFVASCRRAGILPGIYFSTHRNAYWNVWGHYVDGGKGRDTPQQAKFNRIAERMTEELCSRYGDLIQIWFDAGVKSPADGGPNVLPIFEKHQPGSVFYHNTQRSDHRWVGNESGYADDPCWARMPGDGDISHNASSWRKLLGSGDVNGTVWSPAMVDVPFRGHGAHNWFWKPGQDENVYPTERLVEMYYNSVGRNCNLVLGEVVSSDGLVPESDIRRLKEFGSEIKRRFSNPVASTGGSGNVVQCQLPSATTIDQVEIMEEIREGERIRKYECEGLTHAGQWIRLCQGSCVGHKHLHQIKPTQVRAVRLQVSDSVAAPMIRRLAVYDTMASDSAG